MTCSFLKWMGRIMINFFLYLTQLLSSVKKKKKGSFLFFLIASWLSLLLYKKKVKM